jgi:hypothetical protein
MGGRKIKIFIPLCRIAIKVYPNSMAMAYIFESNYLTDFPAILINGINEGIDF